MADYRYAQKSKFSREEEKRFRELFNKWGASVEGYDRKRLGDDIKIVEVWDSPIYRGVIKTQYDKRLLDVKEERIRGRRPTSTKYVNENDIDRWALAKLPTSFTNREETLRVPGCDHIVTCHTCSGRGETTCPKCHGEKTITKKIENKKQCKYCNGWGYTYEKKYRQVQTVEYYTGKPKMVYKSEPYSVKTPCSYCNGKGHTIDISYTEERCRNCNATGVVTCSTCGGDKQMMRYWEMHRRQEVGRFTEYAFPSQIGQTDAGKLCKQFDEDTPWTLLESIDIDKENFAQAKLGSRPIIGSLLERLPKKGVKHEYSTVVCFNRIEVSECEAKTVVYEVDKKQYTCMLIGTQWKLFTVTSPISDKMDSLKEKVNTLCSLRQYGMAWSVLQRVNKFPQAGSNEAFMQEQLEKRMAVVTKFGANLAVVICAILSIPAFFFVYDTLDFFAIWSKWFMEQCEFNADVMVTFSFILTVICSMQSRKSMPPKFSYKVASPFRRFLRGALVGTFDFVKVFLAVIVGAYLGIVQLIGGAVLLVFFIIGFIILIILGLISLIF